AAPFRVVWDSHSVANGTYNLVAVARDAAGNTTASSPVSVTVDNSPPSVVGRNPAPRSTAVLSPAVSTAPISKPLLPSTLSFTLRGPSKNMVPGVVSSHYTNWTATFNPNVALAPSTTYTATVSGAADLAGNAMTAPVSWSFTTGTTFTGATIWRNAVPVT